ncbi:hypothetical protein MUU72_01115 [Streptomyces sp. RS10V-4]|uniref:hypothetical protein n=1 Tax=Streptomyces rhizoryzae TaxID=2932493 RepID=UPI00200336EC|nr:hypothetical protein [Streptomyces rhizoryzae]MCK7621740.1 hypothetical protein [Streptomyces rhizoryzae]
MQIPKRAATGLVSVALVAGAMAVAPSAHAARRDAAPSAATSCYGSAHAYSKPSGSYDYPTGSAYLTTTGNCADINIKTNTNRYVKVCWLKTGNCQTDYTLTTAGQWTTLATNVLDGTDFFFWFRSDASSTGYWAA